MTRSRRNFLRALGLSAAMGAMVQSSLGPAVAAGPTEPSRKRRDDDFVLLNSNENAYGPSPRVAEAIQAATARANRYAFMRNHEVIERIANFHRVKPEQVLFGCGSSEVLRAAACAFLGSGRQLIQASPTFESIQDYARAVDADVTSVPLDKRYGHDLERMFTHAGPSTGLVYICNPNNPTGSLTARKDIEDFTRKLPAGTQVLIDEAYHHFAIQTGAYASFIDTPMDDDRIIVTRTFSKVYALAGLRLGYALASPGNIRKMKKFLTQDSLNSIVAEVAGVALDDTEGVREAVRRNRDDRQEFYNSANIRMLKPIDSHTNFVMTDVMHPMDEVIEHFRKHKVLIGRRFPPMDTYMRVSLGTPAEMQSFWQVWDLIPWSKNFMSH